jgi:ubiquinone/menaquinone biosynthesis C-methylase UbiE
LDVHGTISDDSVSCLRDERKGDYEVVDGILSFSRINTEFGEFSHEEMREIVQTAEKEGWRDTVSKFFSSEDRNIEHLIVGEKRTKFKELIHLSGDEFILDIGCGYGAISTQLSRHARHVVSIDSGLDRLRLFSVIKRQENIDNITIIHNSDILRLPVKSNFFDVIVIVGVFEYLPMALMDQSITEAQHSILRELMRVLKPGGKLYMGTKNRFGVQYLTGAADHNGLKFGPILPRPAANLLTRILYNKPYRIIIDSLPGYKKLFHEAGFTNTAFYWPYPGYQQPDMFVSLDDRADKAGAAAWLTRFSGIRRLIVEFLNMTGLLPYLVQDFSIIAEKSKEHGRG